MLRSFLLVICTLFFVTSSTAQTDTSFQGRLSAYMKYSEEMDLDKALDLTYPRLFTVASREEIKAALIESLESESMTIKLDSLHILKTFPIFEVKKGLYAKVVYGLNMYIKVTDFQKDEIDMEEVNQTIRLFETQFGEGNITWIADKKTFKVKNVSELVAIKNEHSPNWTYLGLEEDSPLGEELLGDEIIQRLDKYKL